MESAELELPPAPVPSMGRTVHHRTQDPRHAFNGSKDHPAVITKVWGKDCVNLKVLPDCGPPYDVTSCRRIDPEDPGASGWFWPPRY